MLPQMRESERHKTCFAYGSINQSSRTNVTSPGIDKTACDRELVLIEQASIGTESGACLVAVTVFKIVAPTLCVGG